MYKMFADKMGWKYEELANSESDAGGFKEYMMALSGSNVYRYLKHEGEPIVFRECLKLKLKEECIRQRLLLLYCSSLMKIHKSM